MQIENKNIDIFIRLLENENKNEITQIALIENDCFADSWNANQLLEEGKKSFSCTLIARNRPQFNETEVFGYINAHIIFNECYINRIAVKTEYRKSGIGGALMQNILEIAKNKNCSVAVLDVRESNNVAIKFYKNFGFENIGIRKNFYYEPKENSITMRKQIN